MEGQRIEHCLRCTYLLTISANALKHEDQTMRNLLALIGLVTVAVKSYEWLNDYQDLKKYKAEREDSAS